MREIGGYFGMEELRGESRYPALTAVNCGRNAVLYLMKLRGWRKLFLPCYLCDSVWKMCEREGYAYEFYHVDEKFRPIFEAPLAKDEALYVVNYFGQLDCEEALRARYGSHLIFDNVQAFFRAPVPGVDTVYSCRKFFGVPDGGYVSAEGEPLPLECDVSFDRMTHILGRAEGRPASDFYADFTANDARFESLPLRTMSPLTENLLRAIDYEKVKTRREENFTRLAELLGARNRLSLRVPEGPYAYPFYCENGPAVRRALAAKGIYIPMLWPDVPEDAPERDYAENILPLPCDQRYGAEEMKQIAEELSNA